MSYSLPKEECDGFILTVDEALDNINRCTNENRYDEKFEFDRLANEEQRESILLDQGAPWIRPGFAANRQMSAH